MKYRRDIMEYKNLINNFRIFNKAVRIGILTEQDYKNLKIYSTKEYKRSITGYSHKSVIQVLFLWSGTPEGLEYWRIKHEQIGKLI